MESNDKTMNSLNDFNRGRFIRLWKNYCLENFGVGVRILVFLYLFFLCHFWWRGMDDMMDFGKYEFFFFFFSYGFVFNGYSVFFFRKFRGKATSAFFLALPASLKEKYWAGLSYSVIIGGILAVLPFLLWKVTLILLFRLQIMPQEWLVFFPVRHGSFPFYFSFFIFSILAWVSSTFWLGGMYFARHAYLKVGLFYIVLVILFSFASFTWFSENSFRDGLWENAGNSYALGFAFLCLAALNIWLAYRLFCKKEIVKTK